MTHHAKASSAGSTEAGGNNRGFLRRAFATGGASSDARGSGACSSRRPRAVLALAIAAFAVTAAPASAAPPAAKMETISNVSYASATVGGRITGAPTCFPFGCFGFSYSFEYSTDQTNWHTGLTANVGRPADNRFVKGKMLVPKGGTKYFVRLKASTLDAGDAIDPAAPPYPTFTTLPVDPPTIPGAVGVSEVFSHQVKLSGKVERPTNPDPAFDAQCRFEAINDTQFDENVTNIGPEAGFEGALVIGCNPNPIVDPAVPTDVGAQPTGLDAGTTYHLRLVAENAAPGAPVVKDGGTFTTQPAVTDKPKVLAGPDVAEVSYRRANFSGVIERPAGGDPALDTYCYFEFVTEEEFTATGFENPIGVPCEQTTYPNGEQHGLTASGPTPVTPFPSSLDLTSGVTYHVRLGARNEAGLTTRDVGTTLTTLPGGEPTFNFDPNPTVGYTTVKALGTVTRGLGFGNEKVYAVFEYAEAGTGNFCGECGTTMQVPPGSGPQNVSYEFTGLNPDTEYEFRMHAEGNEGGYAPPDPGPYTTVTTRHLEKPTVTLDPITTFTGTTALFSGTVDTHAPAGPLDELAKAAYKTEWEFQCTPECKDANGNPIGGTVLAGEGSKAISLEALELHANSYYEVKLVAHNGFYTVESPVQTFQTPLLPPTVTSLPGVSDGRGGYFLEGIVNSNNTKVTSCKFEYGTTATYPNTYEATCLPSPSGPNEVQLVNIEANNGEFELGFRGQTTSKLAYNATPAQVQAALRALSKIGSTGVHVSGNPGAYKVVFDGGAVAGANVEPIKGSNDTLEVEGGGAGAVNVSTETEGGTLHAVSVEAHLEALTIGSTYHFRIIATSAGGTATTPDREFIPTLPEKGPLCPNEEQRQENSSFALPECRAYEQVTNPEKAGIAGTLSGFSADGEAVLYGSGGANIADSGYGFLYGSTYATVRSEAGWKTIANLNRGGSPYKSPDGFTGGYGTAVPVAFSSDFRSSIWYGKKQDNPSSPGDFYLRNLDGTFTKIGNGTPPKNSPYYPGFPAAGMAELNVIGASDDLSHLLVNGTSNNPFGNLIWGPGVYEFVGTGNDQPRPVDVDNSGDEISECGVSTFHGYPQNADAQTISREGRVIVFLVRGGCGSAGPPANELWARVGGVTSINASASQCSRPDCNAPADATFQGAAKDGSRVFLSTTQQLVNADIDQTNDIYACDIPSGNPAPTAGKANPCSAFRQISVAESGAAEVEKVLTTSEDGSTVYFIAKGVLASNEDVLEEHAVAGGHNLYVWRIDAAHPNGQVTFVAKLDAEDLTVDTSQRPQTTSDGRYLVFTTANHLVPTDTDTARDVYGYDADTGTLTRVSVSTSGGGGNTDTFDASITSRPAIANDGSVVFTTVAPLSPLDGNGESDVYLWSAGRVYLITSGAVGGGSGTVAISGSGRDIYFNTSAQLSPSDTDIVGDVYDARIDGGFKFAPKPDCVGEACQPPPSTPSPTPTSPTNRPDGEGNVKPPKPCPKGKVRKKSGKCVKKQTKGQKHKKQGNKHKRTGPNNGGGK